LPSLKKYYLCYMILIDKHKDKLRELCKAYSVSRLYVFGSILSGRFTKESDIDLIVSFDKIQLEYYVDNYYDFKYSLEQLFKRKIDLLEEKAIKNPFFKQSIDKTKRLVYGQ